MKNIACCEQLNMQLIRVYVNVYVVLCNGKAFQKCGNVEWYVVCLYFICIITKKYQVIAIYYVRIRSTILAIMYLDLLATRLLDVTVHTVLIAIVRGGPESPSLV